MWSKAFGLTVKNGVAEASYRVSHIIGTQGKAHTIGETFTAKLTF
jgi:hypothetical protein